MKKEILIVLGAPGSGKSTQSKLIKKNLNYTKITMSKLLKKENKKNTKKAKNIKKIMNKGDLVPYYISCDLLLKKIKNTKKKKIVIDGFPRQLDQAIVFDYFLYSNKYNLKKIIYINTKKNKCVKRLLKRKRKDDTRKAIKERLHLYYKETKKVIKKYKKKDKVIKVNGNKNIKKIYNNIKSRL